MAGIGMAIMGSAFICEIVAGGINSNDQTIKANSALLLGKMDDPETFYNYESFDTPDTIYRLSVDTGKASVFRSAEMDFNSDDFVVTGITFLVTMAEGALVYNPAVPAIVGAFPPCGSVEHAWNQTRAARALGISRDNIRYRMKKYGIRKPA